ncbi:type VI secretion system lipoprotein TssJ [Ralstonia sp. UBA689]|uniref:type VI secretion system lipoprotein TssJ n=1 Tax=Ralstonia sp. UBA689 TaxID=1947373 RepID=UPI0025F9B06C|nr:type VI secretion system lipoprotein TssJ [Ralstonia sp. UBA689]
MTRVLPTQLTLVLSAVIPALLLGACASGDPSPKEATRLELTLNAASTVNPDDQKRPAPIAVRLYELKTDGAFNAADFFTLQDKDKTVLADDLVKRDQYLLRPGEHVTLARPIDPAATTLGVLAAYRDLPNSVWRTAYTLPPARDAAWYHVFKQKLKLTIDLEANAIKVTEVKD